MPPRKTTQGFSARNKKIGKTWQKLSTLQKAIFHPPLFKRLALLITQPDSPEVLVTTNLGDSDHDPRNPIDIAPYIPIFNELVNIKKVKEHIDSGRLGERRRVDYEKKGRAEISKVVDQV